MKLSPLALGALVVGAYVFFRSRPTPAPPPSPYGGTGVGSILDGLQNIFGGGGIFGTGPMGPAYLNNEGGTLFILSLENVRVPVSIESDTGAYVTADGALVPPGITIYQLMPSGGPRVYGRA